MQTVGYMCYSCSLFAPKSDRYFFRPLPLALALARGIQIFFRSIDPIIV